jgi:predicted nucleic acid-binding protein
MKLFIDTWGWICLFNVQENRHEEAAAYYRQIRNQGYEVYTSDYVLDETFTLLFRRIPFDKAVAGLEKINEAADTGYLLVQRVNEKRFKNAQDLRCQYDDKPFISFTDFTSMVLMEELDINFIMTEDDHFSYVESGFKLVPDVN